jgi:hypothetical protein
VKGVSGGERKRTSIGVELITDPELIFLDEPTTGMDSFTALSIMELLGGLAKEQARTVITTIHQPSSDIFEMMDLLVLLAKGKIIYFNQADKSVNYFGSIGFQCPELSNPCDFFMSMMSIESIENDQANETGNLLQDRARIEAIYLETIALFVTKYHESELCCDHTIKHELCWPLEADYGKGQYTGFCYQFNLLAKRNFANIVRLPQTSYVKLLTTVLTASFASILFWNTAQTKYGVQNVQGALFFITMNVSFNAIQNVILIFPDERPVFLREVNNNMYRCTPYFWAKVLSELPFSIITPTVFGLIVYYTVGLAPDALTLIRFIILLILTYNASSGYSLIISAAFSDKQLAVTLTPVLIIPFMLFAGFFVATSSIPIYMIEFEYLSIFKYAYTALLHNQFDFLCPEGSANNGATTYNCFGKHCNGNVTYSGAVATESNTTYYFYACCSYLTNQAGSCTPFSQIAGSWPNLYGAMGMLAAIYGGCYLLSWLILVRLSSTYD